MRVALAFLDSGYLKAWIPFEIASGPKEALDKIAEGTIGVVLQDMNFAPSATSGEEGIELFRAIRRADPAMPVLLMTAWTSLETAVALVRPSKSIGEVDVASVRKKMKDKGFARAVNREDIVKGAEQLGVELDEHIAFVIEALKPVARELGIAGDAP